METIPRLLEIAVSASPQRLAATLGDEQVSYLQVAQASARLANALTQLGVRKHDRVLYWADISLRAIDLFFATSQLGAVFIPANPAFSPAEIDAVLDYLEPQVVVVDAARHEQGRAAAARIGAKLAVLGITGAPIAGFDLETASARASAVAPASVALPADPNVMFLTSGSTGRPKAVVISHRAHWLRTASAPSYDAVCGGRGSACMFPLYHMAGWFMILQAFGRRRPVHLTRQASAQALWSIIETHRPAELYCIPAVWRRLLEYPPPTDGSSLIYALTGTSRVEPDLLAAIRERFPQARHGLFYGSTEMGVSLGIGHDDIETHPYRVGMPMPNVEARLEDGELLLRSDTAMDGYFRLPEETAEVLHDGWYRSGDLATADADGFYEIVGRRREMIRSGGEWVAPAEVEAAVLEMPGVREVAVVGLPHEAWGEMVCAVVVPEPGEAVPTVEAVRQQLSGVLAAFKQPRVIYAREAALPRTGATGQIQRRQVKQDLLAAWSPA